VGRAVDFLWIHLGFMGSAARASASSNVAALASDSKTRDNLGSSGPHCGRDAGSHVFHVAKGRAAALRMAINHCCTAANLKAKLFNFSTVGGRRDLRNDFS
jgi:hypothetical protein